MIRVAPLLLLALVSCIDTELSLDVDLRSAVVTLTADDALLVELVVDVRVGTYALAGDDFIIPRAGILTRAGEPVGEINLERPMGFDGRLEPGQSTVVMLMGSAPAGAFPRARELICGAELEVLVTWTAMEQPDDPLDPPLMSMGNSVLISSDVRCP